jgi:geranylgeranyl diphosphate synthase type I
VTKILDPQAFNPLLVQTIEEILSEESTHASSYGDFLAKRLDYFHTLTITNSKKIRGYLVYLGSQLFAENTDMDDILQLASAMEIFHTAILIHDDIEDDSAIRRGMDTFHIFEEKLTGSKHLGTSLAINIGDMGLFFAAHLMSSTKKAAPEDALKIFQIFSRISVDLAYGQTYDLLSNVALTKDRTFEEILKICNLKTGTYTFLMPLQIGITAGGHADKAQTIEPFAYNAGIVFQLSDDFLDVFSDTQESGKLVCTDLREGKINSITKLTLDKANGMERDYILSILGKKEEHIDVERIRSLMMTSGVYDAMLSYMDTYTNNALEELKKLEGNKKVKAILGNIISSLKARKK